MKTHTAPDLLTLATRAAQAAGFGTAQSERFGMATVRHVAQERDCDALIAALRNPADSPILRLPLLVDDLMRACLALGGTAELTLNPDDTALAVSYAQLLPVHLRECEVVTRADQPRLRITTDAARTSDTVQMPAAVTPPDGLVERLRMLARNGKLPRGAH